MAQANNSTARATRQNKTKAAEAFENGAEKHTIDAIEYTVLCLRRLARFSVARALSSRFTRYVAPSSRSALSPSQRNKKI